MTKVNTPAQNLTKAGNLTLQAGGELVSSAAELVVVAAKGITFVPAIVGWFARELPSTVIAMAKTPLTIVEGNRIEKGMSKEEAAALTAEALAMSPAEAIDDLNRWLGAKAAQLGKAMSEQEETK